MILCSTSTRSPISCDCCPDLYSHLCCCCTRTLWDLYEYIHGGNRPLETGLPGEGRGAAQQPASPCGAEGHPGNFMIISGAVAPRP